MKKFLFLIIFTTFTQTVFSQNAGLQYEMASYSGGNSNTSDRAETRFLNLAMFNQPKFTITYSNFSLGLQDFFDFVIGISIATAIVVFMISAFQQIISGGNISGIKQGKEGMQNAIVGLMIILSTWLIINTVNPDLLRLPMFSGLDGLKPSEQPQGEQNVTGDSAENTTINTNKNLETFTPSMENIAP